MVWLSGKSAEPTTREPPAAGLPALVVGPDEGELAEGEVLFSTADPLAEPRAEVGPVVVLPGNGVLVRR